MSLKDRIMVWAFALLMIAHWLEHAFQAWQVYVMHMPRECALGMLGMKYPWLIRTESLHFGFAVLTTVGILMLWHAFVHDEFVPQNWLVKSRCPNRCAKLWKAAFWISIWHLFEHSLLFGQAILHHNLFGSPVPTSVIQLIVPRIELHLFYNSLVTIPVTVAMVLALKRDSNVDIAPNTWGDSYCGSSRLS